MTTNPVTKQAAGLAHGSEQIVREDPSILLGGYGWFTDSALHSHLGAHVGGKPGLSDLRRMRENPTLKQALHFTKAMLIRADYTIECSDPAIQQAAIENAEEVHDPWTRTALNMFDFGFQGAVKQFKFGKFHSTYGDDKRPVWDDDIVSPVLMAPPLIIPPELARVVVCNGKFHGINATGGLGQNFPLVHDVTDEDHPAPQIKREWAMWFVHEFEEQLGGWYGNSRIGAAFEDWRAYVFTHHMRSRNIEQDGDPALQVWYPVGRQKTGVRPDGTPIYRDNKDIAREIGRELKGGATIAWPSAIQVDEHGRSAPVREWEAGYLTGGENITNFNSALTDIRASMLRAALLPEEVLTETLGGHGSRATTGDRTAIARESLETIADRLDRQFNEEYLDPFVEANWGKNAPKCRRVTTGFRDEDLSLMTHLIESAFNADPNALPLNFVEMIRKSGIPMLSAQEITEKAAEQEKQAQQQAAETARQQGVAQAAGGQAPVPDPAMLQMSGQRKYDDRERIYLSSSPQTDHFQESTAAAAQYLSDPLYDIYGQAIDAAISAISDGPERVLDLAQPEEGSGAKTELILTALVSAAAVAAAAKFASRTELIGGVLATMRHAFSIGHLLQIGLGPDLVSVSDAETQNWARQHAEDLVVLLPDTLIRTQIEPALRRALELQQSDPINYAQIGRQVRADVEGSADWMAKRAAVTEARRTYNIASFDVWARAGITHVRAVDAINPEVSDAHCIERNGTIMTIEQARIENEREHPWGTLHFVPILSQPARPFMPMIALSQDRGAVLEDETHWGVSDSGVVLSPVQVGEFLSQ